MDGADRVRVYRPAPTLHGFGGSLRAVEMRQSGFALKDTLVPKANLSL